LIPEIKKYRQEYEYKSPEGCYINETSNDDRDEDVSVTRARIEPGNTTEWHQLMNTAERYLIISGTGKVELDFGTPVDVGTGDIVRIPPGIPQRITNTGTQDLIFYCICSPRFMEKNYISLE
jgi:mannose-6-phosphate isomerase-like protein (cupin superfamily)